MTTTFYTLENNVPKPLAGAPKHHKDFVWVDMNSPSDEDITYVEKLLGIDMPSTYEMHELEASSRLYSVDNGVYINATLVANAQSDKPKTTAITFVLKHNTLVTLRYEEPKAFDMFINRAQRQQFGQLDEGAGVLVGIMECVIDRLSDMFGHIGLELDKISQRVFRNHDKADESSLEHTLQRVGHYGDLNNKYRESLVSLNRILSYLINNDGPHKKSFKKNFEMQLRDIASLSDHANYLSGRINLLLDATLGMISIEQNTIVKVLSVIAAIFLPPTLIASVYGMNFQVMPELSSEYGYFYAIGAMVITAVLPFFYFKKKGWM